MIQALKGLAAVTGLARPHPGTRGTRRTLNVAGAPGPWYPRTPPPRAFDDTTVDAIPLGIALEVAHEEEAHLAPSRRTWAQDAILAQWRRRMNAWLDHEWLAWRDLLATYPDPGRPA